jgi:hypothetical protein
VNKARHKPDSMTADQGRVEAERAAQIASAQQRLAALRTRMDQAYEDKLDGKVDEQMGTKIPLLSCVGAPMYSNC